jgi:hypothetical protein
VTKYPIVQIRRRKYTIFRPGITLFRAKKNGGPFLKTEVKAWKGINGCLILIPSKTKDDIQIIFLFRRRKLKV